MEESMCKSSRLSDYTERVALHQCTGHDRRNDLACAGRGTVDCHTPLHPFTASAFRKQWTYLDWHALPWNPAPSNSGPRNECPVSGVHPEAILWCDSNLKGTPMPLSINKVGADNNAGSPQSLDDGKTLVDSLMKVVACYRQLSSCVGGCTDSVDLRHQLRRTRERAQELATANRQCLTTHLRDKRLPEEERREAELLWVAFSSCLELLHADMCKVFNIGQSFSLSDKVKTFVHTGIQGETSEMTARALSLRDLNHNEAPSSVERLEQGDLEAEIAQVDQMIEDMEQKVNVLRWTVEASGPQYADPLSADSASLALLSGDEEDPGRCCDHSQVFAVSLLCGTAVAAALLSVLSVCAVYMM